MATDSMTKAVRKVKDVTNILTVLLCRKKYHTRQQERNLVIPNERQTTQSGAFFRCTLKKTQYSFVIPQCCCRTLIWNKPHPARTVFMDKNERQQGCQNDR